MELFFDTETSDLWKWKLSNYDPAQPWVVQVGIILSTFNIKYAEVNLIIQAGSRKISKGASNIHFITESLTHEVGVTEETVWKLFIDLLSHADLLVCHNVDFDRNLMLGMGYRYGTEKERNDLRFKPSYCTMKESTGLCKLPGRYGNYKWPKLNELYNFLFDENMVGAHDAAYDIKATRECYYKLKELESDRLLKETEENKSTSR